MEVDPVEGPQKVSKLSAATGGEKLAVSPLAPSEFPDLPVIDGVQFGVGAAGIKYKNRVDVMVARIDPGASVAGVFTRSATRSAAVLDCEAKLARLDSQTQAPVAFVVNSGNANTFTGKRGVSDVQAVCAATANTLDLPESQVFSASTGVIGEPLEVSKITDELPAIFERLDPAGAAHAAQAIMTTDTFPKGAAAECTISGRIVKIIGIAKGSGMIAPDMATMLGFVFTDARVAPETLQQMLRTATNSSFNAITVDSDTSTSDTVLLAATGRAENRPIDAATSEDGQVFLSALQTVMTDLAHQIVRDGEGATKFVEVRVTGAASVSDADKVARSIANSPLVKTAIAGEDPNWGRVVMAVGKSGAAADRDLLKISFGDILVAENGWVCPTYAEADGATYMKRQELVLSVDLGLGSGSSTVWTCDLTHQYVSINADYRS